MAKKLHENRHHLLWMGTDWKKGYYSRRLRESLVFLMKIETHNKLHSDCPPVPVLSEDACRQLLADLPRLNAYESALWLIRNVDHEGFKKALKAQLPYLKGGVKSP